MKPDCVVQLGDFKFVRYEVPQELPLGGGQDYVVHKMVGGDRVIDTMGRNDDPITWTGRLQGSNALARWAQLDRMRIEGKPLTLKWSQFSYTVIVTAVTGRFQRFYQVLYSITCEVVQDNVKPTKPGEKAGLKESLKSDVAKIAKLGSALAHGDIKGAVAALGGAVEGIGDIARTTADGIVTVTNAINAVRDQVDTLKAVAEGITKGNILDIPSQIAIGAKSVTDLGNTVSYAQDLSNLYGIDSLLGRMEKNITTPFISGKKVVTGGGDLYRLATDNYGDVNAWTDIAKVNGLKDPVLTGVNTIRLPNTVSGNDGVPVI